MKVKSSRFRGIACIATLLLLCIVGSDKCGESIEQPSLVALQATDFSEDASKESVFSAPKDNVFTHLRETNHLGLSSNMLHLRTSAGRFPLVTIITRMSLMTKQLVYE